MNQRAGQDPERTKRLYAAFLVRCWREGGGWRFSLENVATREKRGFDSLPDLALHVQEMLKETGDTLRETKPTDNDDISRPD